jgi:hypothetical protein
MRRLPAAAAAASALTLALLSACNTAHKRAEKLMEEGLFDDAVHSYEKMLAEDPNDTDAALGLAKARQSLLDRRLIEVRRLRQSGSPGPALDVLLDVLEKEQQWNTLPPGAAAFTQEEERQLALPYARAEVGQALGQGFPLKAEHFLIRYRRVFAGDLQKGWDALKAEARAKGKSSCHAFQKEKLEGQPYFARFLVQYCGYWGEKSREIPADREKALGELYGRAEVTVSGSSDRAQGAYATLLSEALRGAFSRTGWFEAAGKRRAEIPIHFTFHEVQSRQPVPQTHMYTVQVPYTEWREEARTRPVPNTNRTESYTERVPVTRYRSVPRRYDFTATDHRQHLDADITGQVALGDRTVRVAVAQQSDTGGIEHGESQPAIGLRPATPTLANPDGFFREQINRAGAELEAQAAQAWVETYCHAPEGGAAEANWVFRCLRQNTPTPPEAAQTWHLRKLGLGVNETRAVLGAQP